LILPLTGMIIGFLTNWVAVELLFRPRKKVWGIQGVIPKRKDKLAGKFSASALHFLPEKIEALTKIPLFGKKISSRIQQEVEHKVKNYPDDELEKVIRKTISSELRFIEFSGAILGLLIGVVQAIIVVWVI
jgi:uncharacterized membrane protein YheB (UPF0754 family)